MSLQDAPTIDPPVHAWIADDYEWPEPWTRPGDGIWYWPPDWCRGAVSRRYATVVDWQRGLGLEVGS